MYTSKILAFATLLCSALAQTPDGFTPRSNKKLAITAAGTSVTPGLLVPRQQTAVAPTVTAPNGNNASSYLLFMIDLDVPRDNTRVTILHWFQPDLVPNADGALVSSSTNASGPGAAYLQPSPPVGDIPHRYTFVVFAQPSNFTVPAAYSTINPPASVPARGGFSMDDFAAAANLGQPVAGNFWTVQNTTAATTGGATASGGAAASGSAAPTATPSGIPFQGAAAGLKQASSALGGAAALVAAVLLL